MKNIIYLIAGILLISCQKEEITPSVRFENLYEIKDNPNDSIQHKIYQLYTDYGVSVFLTDTVGKTFLKTDSRGDSVFIYELLDINYGFSSNSITSNIYKHTFIEKPIDKIHALNIVEAYLKKASKPLRPYALLVTAKTTLTESAGISDLDYTINYRLMLVCKLEKYTNEIKRNLFIDNLMKFMILEKVKNYGMELEAFHAISKQWYEKGWRDLDPTITDQWFTASWLTDKRKPEEVKIYVRSVIGKFGFIKGWKYSGTNSPGNKDEDLDAYLEIVLQTPREEFVRLWSGSPLVMQKYEILYKIIAGELGVEL